MNTGEINRALKARYEAPEWAIFFEVGSGTGANAGRRADAIAMSLWPSRGLELHGFEVKASRSDWLREKANPEKAEPIFRFCDRWWIVAGDPEIVREGELPPTWGLLVPRGKILAARIEAPKLEPQPISRSFLAALLRRAHETAHSASESEIKAAKEAAWSEARELLEKQHQAQKEHGEEGRMRRAIEAFEQASGVKLDSYSAHGAGRIGKAVQAVLMRQHLGDPGNRLAHIRQIAAGIVSDLDAALAPVEEEPATAPGAPS